MTYKQQVFTDKHHTIIEKLAHDGRGIARIAGKTTFLNNALPDEVVDFHYTRRKKSFDEGTVLSVTEPSPYRVQPPCPHAEVCGGCALQHIDPAFQVQHKQAALLEMLQHAGIAPRHMNPPLVADTVSYRRKARLSVRYVAKKEKVLVGFREKAHSGYIADIDSCAVLDARIGTRITALKNLIRSLEGYRDIAQVELAAGDLCAGLIFRHLLPLSETDLHTLIAFGKAHDFWIYLQADGPQSVHCIYPDRNKEPLFYKLHTYDMSLFFEPGDFIQVHAGINEAMIAQAIAWMDLQAQDKVLDLFCGLGNFALPMARTAQYVLGIEGDQDMVLRAKSNALYNNMSNAGFVAHNLMEAGALADYTTQGFDKVLLDPPRAGAEALLPELAMIAPERIVYVSCHPATFVRDVEILVKKYGYRFERAAVMDMFPHTTHIESMGLLIKRHG